MMKFLRHIIFFIAVSTMPVLCYGQNDASTMRFEHTEWNFGKIKEADGPVEHTFTFTNTGKQAIIIEKVSVSCGCTTPSYEKAPVTPGKSSRITIGYNPQDRPGVFNQNIYISSGGGKNRNKITVRGEVVPRPVTIEEEYPFMMGEGLRFSTLSLGFGQVRQGDAKSIAVGYINTSHKPVSLGFEKEPARGFLIVSSPKTVPAGGRGEITVTYDLGSAVFYGRYSDRVWPVINGKRSKLCMSSCIIGVDNTTATVKRSPPAAKFSPTYYNFGKVGRTDRPSGNMTLKNEGKSPLIVRWVDAGDNATTTLRPGVTIKPGGEINFTVTMDLSAGDSGVNTGSLTIITNDPQKLVHSIRCAATLP